MQKPKNPKDWEAWIDQAIREAQERGEFDDLPGKGKPLDLGSNPFAREQELAFKILKDAGFAPEWIELDKAVRGRLEVERSALRLAWERYRERMGELAGEPGEWSAIQRKRAEASWQEAVARFEQEVSAINREIADLNLKVPAPRFQRFKIDPAAEVTRLVEGGSQTGGAGSGGRG